MGTHSTIEDAVYNPQVLPEDQLPTIYGFCNGGSPGWLEAAVVAQDGTYLGGHICSSEGYMPADLGVLEGTRPDRHETFREHYPQGYRMAFVPYAQVKGHAGLQAALEANRAMGEARGTPGSIEDPLGPQPAPETD